MRIFVFLSNLIKNIDVNVKKIMNKSLIFSFIICIISVIILLTYKIYFHTPTTFYVGTSLFQTSLMFICASLIFGIGFDTIVKMSH